MGLIMKAVRDGADWALDLALAQNIPGANMALCMWTLGLTEHRDHCARTTCEGECWGHGGES